VVLADPAPPTIVGLDLGTQSLKAVVTDRDLTVLGTAASPLRPSFPRPGWAEQDARDWEAALGPTIAKALQAAGCEAESVAALGCGGQLDGCIGVDRAGEAVHPCLVWMDRRAQAAVAGLPAERIRERAGVVLDPSHMAAKIRWVKDNHPQARTIVRFHQPVSYLVSRLTGRHVIDHGLASTTMVYSLTARGFDPELLDLFQMSADELPAVAEAADCAGPLGPDGARLTGLPRGIPVAVGTGDDFSTPLGAGLTTPGQVVCVLGTGEVVGALHPEAVIDGGGLVETHAYAGDSYFIENPGWLSGGALAWFKDTFRLADFEELDRLAETVPPGAEGVLFLPALSGAMAPEWIASARGCFYGLTSAHGSGHLARAVLEGTAFAMRDVIQRLGEMGVQTTAVVLLGGGAKSAVWARIRADMTGLPVDVPRITDTSPLGGALLAAVAAGLQPGLAEAAQRLGGIRQRIEPDPRAKAGYDEAHAAYRKLFASLRPLFHDAPRTP
jgi:xylulokinase